MYKIEVNNMYKVQLFFKLEIKYISPLPGFAQIGSTVHAAVGKVP